MKKYIFAAAIIGTFAFLIPRASAQTSLACVNLAVDVASGASDAYPTSYLASGEVLGTAEFSCGHRVAIGDAERPFWSVDTRRGEAVSGK